MNNKELSVNTSENEKLNFHLRVEQKRHDNLNSKFSESKNRRVLLLSAEFALFTFLFSDLQNIVPKELHGIIFFAIGVSAAIVSICLSLYHCKPTTWPDPIGDVEIAKIDAAKDEKEWKQIAIKDYRSANKAAKKILERHANSLQWSLIFFVISVTILLIIKFF